MATAPPKTISDELTDFLAGNPTPEEILAYRLPEALDLRALELLERNRMNALTPEEHEEMEEFRRMGHFMNMLKLKIRMKQTARTAPSRSI